MWWLFWCVLGLDFASSRYMCYRWGMTLTCIECLTEFEHEGSRGRIPKFCGVTCRVRAHRNKGGIPSAMRERDRWVRAVGKRPVMPDGSPASCADPYTWARWHDVATGEGDGWGFMLGDGIGCYDLDDCLVDGVLKDSAVPLVDHIIKNNRIIYSEVSMSGSGLHLFAVMDEQPGRVFDDHEVYSRARFIRMTGNHFEVN